MQPFFISRTQSKLGSDSHIANLLTSVAKWIPPFFSFFKKSSPLSSTNPKQRPFFAHGDWASEFRVLVSLGFESAK